MVASTSWLVAMSVTSDEDAAGDMASQRLEDLQTVDRPRERVDGVLGVRHQAEHVARVVAHPGDVVLGSVRVLPGA